MTPVFDTLRLAQALKEVGFDDRQSVAVVDCIRQSLGDNVAIKSDIADIRADIATLRAGIYRALWIQAAGLVAAACAVTGVVVGVVQAVS